MFEHIDIVGPKHGIALGQWKSDRFVSARKCCDIEIERLEYALEYAHIKAAQKEDGFFNAFHLIVRMLNVREREREKPHTEGTKRHQGAFNTRITCIG